MKPRSSLVSNHGVVVWLTAESGGRKPLILSLPYQMKSSGVFVAMSSPPSTLPSSPLIAYVAAVSAISPVSPAPDLTAKTSIPNVNVDGVKNFEAVTTVANASTTPTYLPWPFRRCRSRS